MFSHNPNTRTRYHTTFKLNLITTGQECIETARYSIYMKDFYVSITNEFKFKRGQEKGMEFLSKSSKKQLCILEILFESLYQTSPFLVEIPLQSPYSEHDAIQDIQQKVAFQVFN